MVERGVFLSDIHMPENIPLGPVLSFVKETKPDYIILGGDVIDAEGLHASESMKAEDVKLSWFKRDVKLASGLIASLKAASSNANIIYLEGNHEQRYARLQAKYPELFAEVLGFSKAMTPLVNVYIPYGTAESYFLIGDTVFVHGDIFPDAHAKAYATRYSPSKVVYGHLHHFQAYTTHRALMHEGVRYALTAGCLSTLNPDWKRGKANQWVNGFVSFWTDGKTTVPTAHMLEKGRLIVGGKEYK